MPTPASNPSSTSPSTPAAHPVSASPSRGLDTPVQFVRGVGPHRASLLARLDIHTARDLLFHIPAGVRDFSDIRPVPRLEAGIEQSVHGRIVDREIRLLSRGRSLVGILIECQGHFVRGLWFNQPWMLKKFRDNERVIYSGKPQRKAGRWEFNNPRVHVLGDEEDPETVSGVLPQYALTDGIKMEVMRRMTAAAVQDFADLVEDPLPASFRAHHQLPDLPTALRWMHQPDSVKHWEAGRYRILLDDLLEFQLGLALRRRSWTQELRATPIPVTAKIDARIRRLFPFRFTAGQDRVVSEIAADLSGQHPMHRLLQADVGAGKTAVAAYAMLAAVAAGHQTALMAPTEVLATQHWETFDELLSRSRVSRCLLLGGLPAAQRRQMLEEIADGRQQLIIGTQALIQDSIRFRNLALVVIDEQHRFGVRQRAGFGTGNNSPHVLVMTATPIPRSLCLTQFGDLDISVINELPPGRQRVVTSRIAGPVEEQRMWEFIRQQVANGRQACVVCPRVEVAADQDDAAAESVFARLTAGELKGLRVDLLHGRMDRQQRRDIMDRFREHQTQVLVSTTVIEVGVDVPNATLMVVQQAERFGLAQLHQLRGRICRGRHQGYCFLLSTSEADDAIERLTAIEKSSDGFELAEIDARLRGPGDILGLRQTGAMPLRYADPVRDLSILQTARRMAEDLVSSLHFQSPEFASLRSIVLERFSNVLDLARSG